MDGVAGRHISTAAGATGFVEDGRTIGQSSAVDDPSKSADPEIGVPRNGYGIGPQIAGNTCTGAGKTRRRFFAIAGIYCGRAWWRAKGRSIARAHGTPAG